MNPTIPIMNGDGKPRLIVKYDTPIVTTREATTFTSTTMTEADGASKTIELTTVASGKGLVVKITGHGYYQGDWVRISGNTSSTPSINGDHEIMAIVDANNFVIDTICSASSDDGSCKRIPAFTSKAIEQNMRLTSLINTGDMDEFAYGKVVDVSASTITVDEWINGTPTNGKVATIDGFVADLPYCKKLTETFTPEVLVHKIYKARRVTKNYGFTYKARLDYSQLITGDTMLLLKQHFTVKDGAQVVLIPRVDTPEYQYNVYLSDPVDTSIFFSNGEGRGHRDMIFVFQGKDLLPDLPIRSSGWGYGWGKLWGYNSFR